MGAESAFLDALAAYLGGRSLEPVPSSIGVAEPQSGGDLPAVVLWLEQTSRTGTGLGEKSELITDGALQVHASIDLAHPVLATDPSFVLLSPDRTVLTLPHGGQVKADGTTGPLTGTDLQVQVAATSRPVVTGTPTGSQVRGDPVLGQLTFGTPLPPSGILAATYFLGQWERRTTRIGGIVDVDTYDADADGVTSLMTGVLDSLQGDTVRQQVAGLHALTLTSLSSIAPKTGGSRKRSARFDFAYEFQNDQPDSSGGIIRQIPLHTNLSVASVDAAGAVETSIVTAG